MKIALSGPGGFGKDHIAALIAEQTGMAYKHSTSWYARHFVWNTAFFRSKYISPEACWEDRRNHRRMWADLIDCMNQEDPAFLYRLCLQSEAILTGVRKRREFEAVLGENLVDYAIWVDVSERSLSTGKHVLRASDDPTQEYGPELCDFSIINPWGDHPLLCRRVLFLCDAIRADSAARCPGTQIR